MVHRRVRQSARPRTEQWRQGTGFLPLELLPPNPDFYHTFNFELDWVTNDANQGCGQTVESYRNAFAIVANSSCGHQGSEQNTLPPLYRPEPAPPTTSSTIAPLLASTTTVVPPPATTTTAPPLVNTSSAAYQECISDMGASNCSDKDDACLVAQ